MRLMFDLPETEKRVLDTSMQPSEKLMYCMPFNILDDMFVSGYIAVTNEKIYKILGDKLLKSYPLAGATGFKTEVMYGCCGFYGNFGILVRDYAYILMMGNDLKLASADAVLNANYTIDYPANDYTVRNELCFIAAAHGGNWIITDENKLYLVPLLSAPAETNYLVEEYGDAITFGGDRILV